MTSEDEKHAPCPPSYFLSQFRRPNKSQAVLSMTPASGVRVGVDSEEGDQSFLGEFPPQPSHTATQRASLFDDILSDVHVADAFHDRCFPYDASPQLNRMVAQTARLPVGGTFTQAV